MQPVTIQTAQDAAYQYRNATLPDNAVWTASVCARCRTAPLIIGKAPVKGKPRRTITVTCPACGDSATDKPGGMTWTDENIQVPEYTQNETRSLAKIPVIMSQRAQGIRPAQSPPLRIERVPESRFNRLTLSVLAAVGRWDYINDIIRRIDRDRGDAATLIALADHIRTNRPERDL